MNLWDEADPETGSIRSAEQLEAAYVGLSGRALRVCI